MNMHVIATDEGQRPRQMSRQYTELIVSSSNYIYHTSGDSLSLVERIPEPAGLVGIPRLDTAALNVLQASKPELNIWEKHPNADQYMHESENFLAVLTPPQGYQNTPELAFILNGTCEQEGVNEKAAMSMWRWARLNCRLVTNIQDNTLNAVQITRLYAKRMQIEEALRDLKASRMDWLCGITERVASSASTSCY